MRAALATCAAAVAVTLSIVPPADAATSLASAQTMPVGNIGNFHQDFAEDFNASTPVGSFQSTYANSWCGYAEGTSGVFYNSQVLSAHDGMMDFSVDGSIGGAGSFGIPGNCQGQTYGKFTIRFKVTGGPGYGTAVLLWPHDDVWSEGELDYPEGSFDRPIVMFQHALAPHCTSGPNHNQCANIAAFTTVAHWTYWHTTSVEWTPGSLKFFLDGVQLRNITTQVPTTSHRWTIQLAPNAPGAVAGHLLVDWAASYTYNP